LLTFSTLRLVWMEGTPNTGDKWHKHTRGSGAEKKYEVTEQGSTLLQSIVLISLAI
jgi:hypothetical protein